MPRLETQQTADTAAAAEAAPSDDPMNDERMTRFKRWCVDRGFAFHPALDLKNVGGSGHPGAPRHNAAFASGPIAPGDVLCAIPKAWCLTTRNASVSSVLPWSVLEGLDEAGLILAVMYERAMGDASPWAPYLATLPTFEPLPYLWDEEDAAEALEGTEVMGRLLADLPEMRADHARVMEVCRTHAGALRAFFKDGVAPPPPARGDSDSDDDDDGDACEAEEGPAGFLAFQHAASLVASRAFQVDDASGQGLVPVADVFNHRGGGKEHIHFTGGDEEDEDEDEEQEETADVTRRPSTVGVKVYPDNDNAEDANAVDAIDAAVDGTLHLIAVAAASAGDELFNTFGDHGNALMLHKYGFCEWDNRLGGVTVPREILCEILGEDVFEEAEAALNGDDEDDEGGASDESEEDAVGAGAAAALAAGWIGGAYEVSAEGEISRDLLLLLAVALADPDDPKACDPTTGLPPDISGDDDALLGLDGVAEALVAVLRARAEALPEGSVEDDLREAKRLAGGVDAAPAGGGCVGKAAATLLRSQERAVIEGAFLAVVEAAKAAREGGDGDGAGGKERRGAKRKRGGVSAPMQGTPYGAIVYPPKRQHAEEDAGEDGREST